MDQEVSPPLPLVIRERPDQHIVLTVAPISRSELLIEQICQDLQEPPAKLGQIEEFVIGCASGLTGATISFIGLQGLSWVFYVLLVPFLLLEIWESWVLFTSATKHNGLTPISDLHRTAMRKRLARQLYGQGVIMGHAGMALQEPSSSSDLQVNQSYAVLSTVAFYALVWLVWIIFCHVANTIPPEDKIAEELVKRKTQKSKSSKQIRMNGSGLSVASPAGPAGGQSRPPRRNKSRPVLRKGSDCMQLP